MSLILKCRTCGEVFTSLMLYDMHAMTHGESNYYSTFQQVAENEIAQGRGNGLQHILDTFIIPKIDGLKIKKVPKEQRINPHKIRTKKKK